ncbi:MAG TPA: TMEM165/GDT1 family protein [Acidimicrobiales bacterium]|nr:TMEM165/GDT1 family protein [Acidimicrobiales bacterium]
MSLTVVAVTFGLMFVAEFPDKTMIATVIMASRYRALPVWLGAVAAFTLHAILAVVAGSLLAKLPHRIVESVIAALFGLGSAYLLLKRETKEFAEGEQEADKVQDPRRVALAAFGIIVVGEFGDLTQILAANLAAKYHQPLSVLVGAVLGLAAVCGVGVVGGRAVIRIIPLTVVRKTAGVLLGGLCAYTVYSAATG